MRWHPNTSERKWRQPRLLLHFVTKFHSRRELGLLTSSSAIHLQKMMPSTLFQSMQTFCEQQLYYTFLLFFFFFCVCMNRPFCYFRLLILLPMNYNQVTPSFSLCKCINFRLCCMHSCAINAKYTFRVGWCKSLKGSTTPACLLVNFCVSFKQWFVPTSHQI